MDGEKNNMALQGTLFGGTDVGGPTEAAKAKSSDLVPVPQKNRRLTPAQREMNRLIKKLEALRTQLDEEKRWADEALAYYGEHLHPRHQRLCEVRKDLVRSLARFFDSWTDKRGRRTLKEMIATQMEFILEFDASPDDDLRSLFQRIHGYGFDEIQEKGFDSMRDDLEELFAEMGFDIDLSDFKANPTPEEAAAQMARLEEAARRQMKPGDEEPRFARKRKSKRQLQREERERQMEEARKTSLASIYKQLAKVIHPDLEQDPERRQQKVRLMQDLTTAYKANDLHTLLRLELEWIHNTENDLDRLTDEKLAIYNQVLREQVSEVKMEIHDLAFDPKYRPLVVVDVVDGHVLQMNGPAEAAALDEAISELGGWADRLRNSNQPRDIRAAIAHYRAVKRREEAAVDGFWDGL